MLVLMIATPGQILARSGKLLRMSAQWQHILRGDAGLTPQAEPPLKKLTEPARELKMRLSGEYAAVVYGISIRHGPPIHAGRASKRNRNDNVKLGL